MDKKPPASLDPKLKEAYDRVMGFTPPPAAASSTKPAAPAAHPVTPPPPPQMPTAKVVNNAVVTPTTYQVNEIPTQSLPPKQVAADSQHAEEKESAENNSPLKPILYSIGGGVFFLVYAYVWAKILNISLPF